MKKGWPIKRLGDVCEIIMGQSPDGDSYNTTGEGVPLINGPVEFSRESFGKTIRSKFTTQPTKLCKEGDLILCVRGSTTGRMNIAGFDACVGRGVAAIRAKQYQPWINHFISSKRDEIHGQGTGATFPNVSGTILADFELVVPPLPEQQRIVGILDKAFEGIAAAQANAEKNLQNARAIFKSHLQSVFTQRDEGWKRKPLGSLCELISGQHIDAKDYNTEGKGVGYLTGPSDFGFVNPVITKWSEHPKRMAKRGDILVTVKGSGVGKINLLDAEEVAISRQLMAVRATTADVSYLYAFLSTNFDYFQSLSKGAAIPGISREDVLDLMCPMPPPGEQQAIVKLIHAMSQETQRLASVYERKLAALEALKKSLLHQAFNGEL
jgi:type I restriction enzyme S subunit